VSRPHRWDTKFIQRFMIVFGLLSSFYDFLTFGVLLFIMKADEKVFQTGWFVESVVSATLIVLVVRTRLPFFKSLPGRYLAIATVGVVGFVLLLPMLPIASLFGFVELPFYLYIWMLLIVSAYIFSAEMLKHWFYNKLKNKIT